MISGMKYDREHGMSLAETAKKYKISTDTVSKYAPIRSKLSSEQRQAIMFDIDSGMKCKEVAEKHGVNINTVYNYLPSMRGRSHHVDNKNASDNNSPQPLPSEIISVVGGRMEELEADIKKLKDKLFELEKEHSSLEKWLNKNGVDTSVV